MTCTNETKLKAWTVKKKLLLAVALTGFVLLVYFNVYAAMQLQHEEARLEAMEHFEDLQQRQEQVESQLNLMTSQLYTMYHACRSAEDFFIIFDHEIASIANTRQLDSLQLLTTVPPEGSHRLRIVVTRGYSGSDLYRKTIPIASDQTNEIQLTYGRQKNEKEPPRNVALNVNGEKIELPIPQFSVTSTGQTSIGSHEFFRQPNQKLFYTDKLSHNKIADFHFSGEGEDEKVRIQVYIDSDGPMRSAADDQDTVRELIGRIHLNDSEEIVQYDPQGWYTFE